MMHDKKNIFGPAHEILVLLANAQKLPLNAHADLSGETRDLWFGLSLHLLPYFVSSLQDRPKIKWFVILMMNETMVLSNC